MYSFLPYISLSLEKTGGLFDIDGTLPVLLIQFFVLVQLLSVLLFNPIQKILKQREEEIENNLKNARVSLEEVEKLQQKIRRITQVIRERHQIRAREIESKRQTALLLSKKYMEGELRQTRQKMVVTYKTAASNAGTLIPDVMDEINKYLKVRPPIQHI